MAADMPKRVVTVCLMNEGHPGARETFPGFDVTARQEHDGSLVVTNIDWGDATGYRIYAKGSWHSVEFSRRKLVQSNKPPAADPEAIGAADPTPGVVQALSGAQGLSQAGVNEDG